MECDCVPLAVVVLEGGVLFDGLGDALDVFVWLVDPVAVFVPRTVALVTGVVVEVLDHA